MSALARMDSNADLEGAPMREKLAAVRDTMVVLGLQVVFRAFMILRRLNY
ncbi:MAG: hypothetical protein ABSE45_05240 [Candidatus Acidiferrales bacterium]|jgi:hypothetical protein